MLQASTSVLSLKRYVESDLSAARESLDVETFKEQVNLKGNE